MRSTARAALAAAVTMASVLSLGGVAVADPTQPIPSQQQVDKARADVAAKARSVAAIRSSLVVASQQLASSAEEAEMAAEAYLGAMYRLGLAKKAVIKAKADAARSRAQLQLQRDGIAQLITQSYQEGTELNSVTAMLGPDGTEGVMNRYGAFQSANDSMRSRFDRFTVVRRITEAYEIKAKQAVATQARLADKAKASRDAAAASAAAAQAEANQIAYRKQALMAELAQAQQVSITVATSRQKALEAVARQQAAAAAIKTAADHATKSQDAQKAQDEAKKAAAIAAAQRAQNEEDKDQWGNDPVDPGAYFPQPEPGHAPPVSSGAQRAIEFASAQLGEMYLWAAAGPDRWDCSGLTMMAWRAGGKSLPHYSAAQFSESTAINAADLQPGDLVFWGGSPASIHHVALYIGGQKIIHAPRTGQPVQISPLYAPGFTPNFFARP